MRASGTPFSEQSRDRAVSVVLSFWATALLVGALALPLCFRLFRRFPDGGAGLSFALGITLVGWGYFILRTLEILPAGRGGAVLAVGLLALAGAGVAGRDRRFRSTLRMSAPSVVAISGVFTLCLFGYVAFRSYAPEIAGTEQPMDLMYLTATMNSPDYPPQDPWLAGEPASYYYFGYLQVGILTHVSGASASEGYNLGLAFTFAAAATAVASVVLALTKWVLGARARHWAIGAAGTGIVLLLLLGSLAGALELAAAHGRGGEGLYDAFGVPWMRPCEEDVIEGCRPESDRWYPTAFFFWFEDSRIIRSDPDTIPRNTDTITEFPAFSFVLGDLHPHVMSLPLVLLVTGVAAAIWRGRSRLELATLRRDPFTAVLVALLLGALAFQNAWDLLTFSGLVAAAVLARNLRRRRFWPAARDSAGWLGPVLGLAIVAYLPWYLDFSSQAEGLYPYVGVGSRPNQAFLQFGALFFAAVLAATWAVRRNDRTAIVDSALYASWTALVPMLLWIALALYHRQLGDAVDARGAGGWATLAIYAAGVWLLATLFVATGRQGRPAWAFPLGVGATGVLLLYGAELFFIKDVFFGGAPRLNTIFKLSYQAWALLSVAGAVALTVAAERAIRARHGPSWLFVPVASIVAVGLVFVVIAVPNRTDSFSGETTVDGLAFLARSDAAEYDLTRWLEDNVPAGDVILEATGRQYGPGEGGAPVVTDPNVDYGDGARISSRTGRQTPIGWYFHEIQWRGDNEQNQEEFRTRQDLVDRAYTTDDPQEVLDVLRETGATWVVVGSVERRKYGGFLPDFDAFMDVAYATGDYRVYRIPESRVVPTS
jgi:YYY domain-containing protein